MSIHQSKSALRHQAPPSMSLDETRPLVVIVDDDAVIREALSELLLSVGIDTIGFASKRAFLDAAMPDRPGCLILEVRLPGSSGLDLQSWLASSGNTKPLIFLTGHGDIEMTVRAMRAGAIDFLTKPFRPQTLLDAVNAAIERDISLRAEARVIKGHADRLATLTPREREVLGHVARGRLNKQIAYDLGISEVTVKLHRSNARRKMQAGSVGELVRAWDSLPAPLREQRPGPNHRFNPGLAWERRQGYRRGSFIPSSREKPRPKGGVVEEPSLAAERTERSLRCASLRLRPGQARSLLPAKSMGSAPSHQVAAARR
jgi:FixJ family two-component response regulator